jgi:hypothetical protein
MPKTRNNRGQCKYCGGNLIWKDSKPIDESTGKRHWCDKYPKAKTVEVTRTVEPQDLVDLREKIGYLENRLLQQSLPRPEPTNNFEKRIMRLESIIVEMNKNARYWDGIRGHHSPVE